MVPFKFPVEPPTYFFTFYWTCFLPGSFLRKSTLSPRILTKTAEVHLAIRNMEKQFLTPVRIKLENLRCYTLDFSLINVDADPESYVTVCKAG